MQNIIRKLQLYKLAWQKIFQGRQVNLGFENGEITIELSTRNSSFIVDKKAVHQFNFSSPLLPEEYHKLAKWWKLIQEVDAWLEQLSPREREAIFWKYIQHDFEQCSVYDEINTGMIWQTLSERQIAEKMGIARTTLQEYIDRALEKIKKFVCYMVETPP